jgi:hypothetical protein
MMRKIIGYSVVLECDYDFEENYFDHREEAEKHATNSVLTGKWTKASVVERAEVTTVERKLKIAKAK